MNTRVGRWAPMLVVPAMVLAMAGCSGDDKKDDDAKKADGASDTSSPDASETPTANTTSPADLPVPPTVGQAVGIVADVDWDPAKCETSAGTQTVEGSVSNKGDKATGILVAISWTNATNDTLGVGFQVLRGVKPDEERDFKIEAEVAEGAAQCVMFAQRGVIKK